MNGTLPSRDFWFGKKVLLTGHSGFKGTWLALWLGSLGAKVTGLSLRPSSVPNLHQLTTKESRFVHSWKDVCDKAAVIEVVRETKPEIVFHLAAQALVLPSYRSPSETFAVNVQGAVNVLEAARLENSVRSIVVVTTDKIYRNDDSDRAFREDDPLGGHDPYSASKAAAEMVVASYRSSFFAPSGIGVAAARAGNVVGGGDWSEDRIIPDAIRAWGTGRTLVVRNPDSTRPWQHVLDPLVGYLRLAEFLYLHPERAQDFNFGPDQAQRATVRDVVLLARNFFGRGDIEWSPNPAAVREARVLSLDNSKATDLLGVRPIWDLETTVSRAMRWYRRQMDGEDARALCLDDIEAYYSEA